MAKLLFHIKTTASQRELMELFGNLAANDVGFAGVNECNSVTMSAEKRGAAMKGIAKLLAGNHQVRTEFRPAPRL